MENRSIHDDVWLAPWDPEWVHEFHMEKQCIVGSMMAEEHSAFVRHVGSTAIEGMPAKPIIDMCYYFVKLVTFQGKFRFCVSKFRKLLTP